MPAFLTFTVTCVKSCIMLLYHFYEIKAEHSGNGRFQALPYTAVYGLMCDMDNVTIIIQIVGRLTIGWLVGHWLTVDRLNALNSATRKR